MLQLEHYAPTQLAQSERPSGIPYAPLFMKVYDESTSLIYQSASVRLKRSSSKPRCLATSLSLIRTDPLSYISLDDEPEF